MLENTLPNNFPLIVLVWTRKSYKKSINATCESNENCQFSAQLGLAQFISGREIEKYGFGRKYRNIWSKETHGVFTFTKVYFYAKVGRLKFYSLTGLYLLCFFCGHLLLMEILFILTGKATEGNKHIQCDELFALVSIYDE